MQNTVSKRCHSQPRDERLGGFFGLFFCSKSQANFFRRRKEKVYWMACFFQCV